MSSFTFSVTGRLCHLAVVHAPAARIAAWGRFRNDGAPARNHGAIMLSKIMHPNAELGMNGQMGLPHR